MGIPRIQVVTDLVLEFGHDIVVQVLCSRDQVEWVHSFITERISDQVRTLIEMIEPDLGILCLNETAGIGHILRARASLCRTRVLAELCECSRCTVERIKFPIDIGDFPVSFGEGGSIVVQNDIILA